MTHPQSPLVSDMILVEERALGGHRSVLSRTEAEKPQVSLGTEKSKSRNDIQTTHPATVTLPVSLRPTSPCLLQRE